MSKRPKKRTLYLVEWWDIEGDAGWGEGADRPPIVVQPAFILSWPRKNQKPPCYKIVQAFVEETPGGASIIPEACVVRKPEKLCDIEMRYR